VRVETYGDQLACCFSADPAAGTGATGNACDIAVSLVYF
jgi:hypothetical protein